MEALKSLMRLAGDLAFTVLDGIDQMLAGGRARPQSDDDLFATMNDEYEVPVINPATGLFMVDGQGSFDSGGNLYGSSH